MHATTYSPTYSWNLRLYRRQGRAKFHRSGCQLHPVVLYHGGETAGDATRSSVDLRASCDHRPSTGADSDQLVRAILAHQHGLNHPYKDGRVSIAKGDQKLGDFAFMVYRIGARIAYIYPRELPRLDLIPGCPASVARAVQEAVPKLATD